MTMIERVAAAIQRADRGDCLDFEPGYFLMARAAIAAMREPTEEMTTAAETAYYEIERFPGDTPLAQDSAAVMHRAMIDAALKTADRD